MFVSEGDRDILATRHGNAYEAKKIILRLADADHKYCSQCTRVKPLDAFAKMRAGNRQMRCKLCAYIHKRKRRSYAPVAGKVRDAERQRRYRTANLILCNLRKRLLYWRRRAAGMRGRVAAYKEPE